MERTFFTMNILKNRLQNRIGDQWMNDHLLVYIEKDTFDNIDNETIMQHFQNIKFVEVSCKIYSIEMLSINITFLYF